MLKPMLFIDTSIMLYYSLHSEKPENSSFQETVDNVAQITLELNEISGCGLRHMLLLINCARMMP